MSDTALSVPEFDPRDAGTKIPVRFPDDAPHPYIAGTPWALCWFCTEICEPRHCHCCDLPMCGQCLDAHVYVPCDCPECSEPG